MRQADWYFDYISPFPWIALSRFGQLPDDLEIRPVPVVFAGLLKHWGHKGPAEIEAKRIQTFRMAHWTAAQRDLPFRVPPTHPFNPLALLRLTISLGSDLETVRIIAGHVWGEGHAGDTPDSLDILAARLGVTDWQARVGEPDVKARLHANTDAAIARGVYGVPTFDVSGELFWGDDALPMMLDFIETPVAVGTPQTKKPGP